MVIAMLTHDRKVRSFAAPEQHHTFRATTYAAAAGQHCASWFPSLPAYHTKDRLQLGAQL